MHLPGYNWCGPGTKVNKRLARNDPGVNGLDEACKEHDIFYSENKDTKTRHFADKVLAAKALERFRSGDAIWKEKAAVLGVAGAMKAKLKLGLGFKTNNEKNISKSAINTCVKRIQKSMQELDTMIPLTKETKSQTKAT
ncbi:hypothetical protein NQ315_016584 [Exocentrus adspersus]|uniref:Phospholipase A2-like domain-containing protein n=1 Tax=Exocentrus adspersus TaxID=1586481 RepID=A0AAV8VDF6_9CUCU|nr:hypothetical protein NQ315_016584 [Exocentrus adspersus]